METLINQNLSQWMTQWLAIEHPKNISLTEKMNEYRKWKSVWDIWYLSPNLEMSQAIKVLNEQNKV